jgi:hypothetical protein
MQEMAAGDEQGEAQRDNVLSGAAYEQYKGYSGIKVDTTGGEKINGL